MHCPSYILFFKMQFDMKTFSPRPPLFLSLTTDPVGQGSSSEEESILQLNRFKTSSSILSFDFHCRNPHKRTYIGDILQQDWAIQSFSLIDVHSPQIASIIKLAHVTQESFRDKWLESKAFQLALASDDLIHFQLADKVL